MPTYLSGDTDWQDVMYETGYVYNNEVDHFRRQRAGLSAG